MRSSRGTPTTTSGDHANAQIHQARAVRNTGLGNWAQNCPNMMGPMAKNRNPTHIGAPSQGGRARQNTAAP